MLSACLRRKMSKCAISKQCQAIDAMYRDICKKGKNARAIESQQFKKSNETKRRKKNRRTEHSRALTTQNARKIEIEMYSFDPFQSIMCELFFYVQVYIYYIGIYEFRFIFQAENFNKYLFPFLYISFRFCPCDFFSVVLLSFSLSLTLSNSTNTCQNTTWFPVIRLNEREKKATKPFWIFQMCRQNSNQFTVSWLKIDWIFFILIVLLI